MANENYEEAFRTLFSTMFTNFNNNTNSTTTTKNGIENGKGWGMSANFFSDTTGGRWQLSPVPSSFSASTFTISQEFPHNTNIMQYSFPPTTMDWRVEYVAHFIVMPVLLAFGLIFQCLNLLTLRKLVPVGYLYLKASAVADILSVIAFIPFCMRHGNLHNAYNYNEMFFHAHIELPLINSLITASTLCLTMMTVDRFLSVCCPIQCFKGNGSEPKTRIRSTIVILYVISFLLFIPSAWQRILVPFNEHTANGRTRMFWQMGRNFHLNKSQLFLNYLVLRECVARLFPIFILVVFNFFIIWQLHHISSRNNTRRVVQTEVSRERDNDRTRISIMLVITSANFVICTLPASFLSFFFHNGSDGLKMQIFRAAANCLQVSHYLHYFYLYAMCSSEYRQALCKVFHCGPQLRRHSFCPTTTETHLVRSRLSSTLLGQIRHLGFYRYSRKLKPILPQNNANGNTNEGISEPEVKILVPENGSEGEEPDANLRRCVTWELEHKLVEKPVLKK